MDSATRHGVMRIHGHRKVRGVQNIHVTAVTKLWIYRQKYKTKVESTRRIQTPTRADDTMKLLAMNDGFIAEKKTEKSSLSWVKIFIYRER